MTVQSVLDVKDDNPLPKSANIISHFNRSILILTPERALKFTATTQERHYVWLTALSFLSHSPLSIGDLAALPPPQQADPETVPSLGGSLRRRQITDSIRLAKGPGRPGQRSFTADEVLLPHATQDAFEIEADYDPISDAALPPTIPRFSHHTRKRSNTGPRAPPSSYRNFSPKDPTSFTSQTASYSYSMPRMTATSSDRGMYTPSLGMHSVQSSRRGSEASATVDGGRRPSASQGMGSLDQAKRMEAFIDNKDGTSRPRGSYRTRQGRKKDLGYWGVETVDGVAPIEASIDGLGVSTRTEDPFRGF